MIHKPPNALLSAPNARAKKGILGFIQLMNPFPSGRALEGLGMRPNPLPRLLPDIRAEPSNDAASCCRFSRKQR